MLNREFMLAVAEGTRANIDQEVVGRTSRRRVGAPSVLDDLPIADLQELAQALAGLPAELGEPGAADDASVLPGGEAGPRDDYVFLPHNQLMSLLQSAIEEAIEQHQPDAIEQRRVSADRRRGDVTPAVTGRRLRGVELQPDVGNRRVWRQMEVAAGKWAWLSDPRWVLSGLHLLWRNATGDRSPFVERPPRIRISNDAQIIVIGDWGSGLERADSVASQIRAELAKQERRQQVVVHLGDVYYSGTKREFSQRFLEPWPVDTASPVISLAVPGNHEMYSGGHAYFDALADSRFKAQDGCSYFALENDFWQFLGLDTAYEDGGLYGDQARWARARIVEAPAHLRTCLFSHHQLYSAHQMGAKALQVKIEPVLATERVDAWFWGHEHRCIVYSPTTWDGHRMGFASCVGHGGIPEYLVMKEKQTCSPPWVYEYLKPFDDGIQPWGTFGFAVIDLHDSMMSVRYIDEHGTQHYQAPDVPGVAR